MSSSTILTERVEANWDSLVKESRPLRKSMPAPETKVAATVVEPISNEATAAAVRPAVSASDSGVTDVDALVERITARVMKDIEGQIAFILSAALREASVKADAAMREAVTVCVRSAVKSELGK